MDKFRARNFNLVLYDEDETHRNAINYIQKNYDYAMILHDRDKLDNGELKKPHYHIVLRFQNAKWNTSLAEELGITENYIEECRSLKRSLLYLIHYYDEDKFQYAVADVKGSLTNRLYEILTNGQKTETEKMQDIIDYIDSLDNEIDMSQFVRYCVSIGYTDVMRRCFTPFSAIINKHNSDVERRNKNE